MTKHSQSPHFVVVVVAKNSAAIICRGLLGGFLGPDYMQIIPHVVIQ